MPVPISAILLLLVAVYFAFDFPSSSFHWLLSPPQCPYHFESCFFGRSYYSARANFLFYAKKAGAELYRFPIASSSAQDDLSIDIAVVTGKGSVNTTDPLLLSLSGIHGVEGYAGSAIQSKFLHDLALNSSLLPTGMTCILVHAMNPFGFLHGRRWNENNVDLNRNMVPSDIFPQGFKKLAARDVAEYKSISHAVNIDHAWVPIKDDFLMGLSALKLLLGTGFVTIKKALVKAQYIMPEGVFYGGEKLEASHEVLLTFLKQMHSKHEQVLLLDVHTGLGPSGVDTLMLDDRSALPFLKRAFGSPSESDPLRKFIVAGADDDEASKGYEETFGTTVNYLEALRKYGGWQRAVHVTQEFGTVPALAVIRSLTVENSIWNHGSSNIDQKVTGATLVKNTFYPQSAVWERAVVLRGVHVMQQALAALATPLPINSATAVIL